LRVSLFAFPASEAITAFYFVIPKFHRCNRGNDAPVPCFLTIILIPCTSQRLLACFDERAYSRFTVTFNIAYGLIAGIIAMFHLKGLPLLVAKVSNNRVVSEDFEKYELWQKLAGGFAPLWMRKLARGDKKLWLPDGDIPSALPTHTKDDSRSISDNEKLAREDVPPPLHSLPLAGPTTTSMRILVTRSVRYRWICTSSCTRDSRSCLSRCVLWFNNLLYLVWPFG